MQIRQFIAISYGLSPTFSLTIISSACICLIVFKSYFIYTHLVVIMMSNANMDPGGIKDVKKKNVTVILTKKLEYFVTVWHIQ